jgi:toxin CcdB
LPRQFDIVANPNARTRRDFPFLIILQSDRAASFSTVIAAPLAPVGAAFERSCIHPVIDIVGSPYFIFTERLAAISISGLGEVVATGAESRYEIVAALDMLFTGI